MQLVQLLDLELGGLLDLDLWKLLLLLLRLGGKGEPDRHPMGHGGNARLPTHGDHHHLLSMRPALQLLLLAGSHPTLMLLERRWECTGGVSEGGG